MIKYSNFLRVLAFVAGILTVVDTRAGAAKEIKDFHLGGPVLIKTDWSSELLRWGDLNHDGKLDFLTLNNRLNRLEVFIQTGSELKPFDDTKWTIERAASDVLILDMNGDGRDDVLLAAKPCQVLLQDENGQFDVTIDLDFEAKFVFALDLNGDKREDLLAVQNDKIVLAVRGADGKTPSFEKETLPSGHAPLFRPLMIDLNQDGLDDLAFISAAAKDSLIVRQRNSVSRFNPERAFQIGFNSSFDALDRGKDGVQLAAVEEKTQTAKLMAIKEKVALNWQKFPFDEMQVLPFTSSGASAKPQYCTADLNRDGFSEIFRFDSESAEVNRYRSDKNGASYFDRFPTLANVKQARYAEYQQGKVRQLVCISPGEEALALIREDKDGKLGVPLVFDPGVKPLVFDLADVNGDGNLDLIVGAKNDLPLRAYTATANGDYVSTPPLPLVLEPKPSMDDVNDMIAADFDQDGAVDLMFFYGFNPPQIYLQNPAAKKFEPLLTNDGMKRGLFNELRPEFISLRDFDGDGHAELILLKKDYARVIALSPGGDVKLLAQYNGADSRANLTGIAFEDLDGDGKDEVLLLDRGNRQLTIYQAASPDQIFHTLKLEGADCLQLHSADVNGDGADDLIVENRDSAGLLLRNIRPRFISALSRHATEIEEGKYADIRCLDFDQDGADEIVLLEQKEDLLEFYQAPDEAGDWQRFYKFKVFQGDGPMMGYFKINDNLALPRQIDAVDYDGDKRSDLVLLIHDSIIIYPQLKK